MAFRLRDPDNQALWSAATLRPAAGGAAPFPRQRSSFEALRHWRSPRTDISYPVAWRLRVGHREFELQALLDDQELDSRALDRRHLLGRSRSPVRREREIGRGYLEMTGYGARIRVG